MLSGVEKKRCAHGAHRNGKWCPHRNRSSDKLRRDAATKELTAYIQDTMIQGHHEILLATTTNLCSFLIHKNCDF